MKLFTLLVYVFSIVAVTSGQNSIARLYKTSNSFVSFSSEAPLELIYAESNELKGIIDPARQTFAFQLDVRSLKGFNSPLQQEHFYENYMESDKYTNASFSGKIIEKINFETNGTYSIRAKGILDIHGVKQERIIELSLQINKPDVLVKLSRDACSTFEFHRAKEMIDYGSKELRKALAESEKRSKSISS